VPFDEEFAALALSHLRDHGVTVLRGLDDSEVEGVEVALGHALPPELGCLLRVGLPHGDSWPDWRTDPLGEAASAREWVVRAFESDVVANSYWRDDWGERPTDMAAAAGVARSAVLAGPPLARVFGHRFMPTKPHAEGNPVLSVWQAVDTIYYGADLADYLHREFQIPKPAWAASKPRPVEYWGRLFDL
jgi:hypothetical protein